MQKTSNYNLNQWEATDPIRREAFNADNAAIDMALAAMAAGMSSCRVAYGSYDGTNEYGAESPVTLSFDFKPLLVVVSDDKYGTDSSNPMVLCHGQSMGLSVCGYQNDSVSSTMTVSWGSDSVSWYNETKALWQNNGGGHTYYYVVLGVAE